MKKPNRKDFPNNRNGSSRYNAAVRKYNTFIKNKNKPVNTDPRPKIGDFPNREAYRQAVLKWNKRRKDKIAKQKNEELKQKGLVKTSRGLKKRKTNNSLKVKPKGPYAKDRVGQVDLTSTAYKEAKAANEKPVEYQTNQNNQNNTSDKKDKQEKVKTPKYKQVTQEELDKKLAEGKNKKEVKEVKKKTKREKFNEKFIRTKKGTLARRGSVNARRAENREAARKRAQAAAKLRIKKKKEKK